MNFLKKIFNDDKEIIGLSGFKGMKRPCNKNPIENKFNFNPIRQQQIFETNFVENKMLL